MSPKDFQVNVKKTFLLTSDNNNEDPELMTKMKAMEISFYQIFLR